MDINNPFYIEILKSLNQSKVEYVLIGGLAVSYHGYSRYTGDMDLWINPDGENIERLYDSLLEIGYPEDIVNQIRKERQIDDPTPIKLNDDNNRLKVDLMTDTFQREFSWQECYNQSNKIELDEVIIPVIHINQLIWMKENSSRIGDSFKDLVDAQELRKIVNMKREG